MSFGIEKNQGTLRTWLTLVRQGNYKDEAEMFCVRGSESAHRSPGTFQNYPNEEKLFPREDASNIEHGYSLTETWELPVSLSDHLIAIPVSVIICLPFPSVDRVLGQDEGKAEHLSWAARGHCDNNN